MNAVCVSGSVFLCSPVSLLVGCTLIPPAQSKLLAVVEEISDEITQLKSKVRSLLRMRARDGLYRPVPHHQCQCCCLMSGVIDRRI